MGYVIAASAISAMQHLVQDGQSPLFLQFEALEVARFPVDATQTLAERILDAAPPVAAGRGLHELTGGHPFYIHAVTTQLHGLVDDATTLIPAEVERAFLLETLNCDGRIYNYCRYLYDILISTRADLHKIERAFRHAG